MQMTATEKENLIVSNGLVKIVGIFEFDASYKKHIKKIKSDEKIIKVDKKQEKVS